MATMMRDLFGLVMLLCVVLNGRTQDMRATSDAPLVHAHTVQMEKDVFLKGEITEWGTDSIVLRLLSGGELRIPRSEIVKIRSLQQPRYVTSRHDRSAAREVRETIPKAYNFREHGIYNVTSIGFSIAALRDVAGIGITHATGHRFSRLFGVGIGTGFETFEIGTGLNNIPIFGEARGYLLGNTMSPYYAVRLGYGVATQNNDQFNSGPAWWWSNTPSRVRGGAMFAAELGYRFGGTRNVNFFSGMGVRYQRATYWYDQSWRGETSFVDRIWYRRVELKIGVVF